VAAEQLSFLPNLEGGPVRGAQWRGPGQVGDHIEWGGNVFEIGHDYSLLRIVFEGLYRRAWEQKKIDELYKEASGWTENIEDRTESGLDDIQDAAEAAFADPTGELDAYAHGLDNPFDNEPIVDSLADGAGIAATIKA
jgi:hypothetical protein